MPDKSAALPPRIGRHASALPSHTLHGLQGSLGDLRLRRFSPSLKPQTIGIYIACNNCSARVSQLLGQMAATRHVCTYACVIPQSEVLSLLEHQLFRSVSSKRREIEIRRRLHHLRIDILKSDGAPGPTRTGDPLLRRQTLYPTELRAHVHRF